MFKKRFLKAAISAAVVLCSSNSFSQVALDTVVEVEVDRPISELDPRPVPPITPDTDAFDTAIVLTSYQDDRQLVRCAAFDADGNAVGRTLTKVPGHGVRLLFASDLANDTDYIGKVTCASRGDVAATAYLVGAVFSDLDVFNQTERSGSFIRIPLTFTR